MGAVTVAFTFEGSVHEAEQCWYDTRRWPMWVDGLESVVEVRGDWPRVGSEVIWQSGPAGRGRVRERVVEFEALAGARLDVEDESIRGSQSVSFTPVDGSVEVRLSLEYKIKRSSPVTPLVDRLFIRRPMVASLQRTVSRFGVELAAQRARPPSERTS